MSREKLTESLLEKRDAKARAIWQEAELRLHRHRQQARERCTDQRQELEVRLQAELSMQLDRLQTRIDRQRRQLRLRAEETFSERLRQLAIARLSALPAQQRTETLRRLAHELPERDWRQIITHPDDQPLARQLFSDAEIESDPQLIGGLIAVCENGSIRIDNSLSRRLERGWPQLCGRILDALRTPGGA